MMTVNDIDQFFGRKETLDLLKRRVFDLKEGYRQNLALLGERYIGKSMLLRKFFMDLDDKDIIAVCVGLEGKDLEYFCDQMVGGLLAQYSLLKGLPVHEDNRLFLAGLQNHIPSTVRAVKKIYSHLGHEKKDDCFRELISLPQILAKETQTFCVVVLEEFDSLEAMNISGAFVELGKKIMTQKRCLYLVTSSCPSIAQEILSEKLSLLFGNFEVLRVEPFDLSTSRTYVERCLKGLTMKELLRDFLVDFTGGHPLYLHLLCQEIALLAAVHQQKEIFTPLLCQAVENLLFNPWGMINRHFEIIVKGAVEGRGNLVVPRILIALANGKQKVKEIVQASGLRQGAVSQRLHRLVDAGVVVKSGNLFYIRDKLLRYWVRFVLQKNYKSVQVDPSQKMDGFRSELSVAIDQFKVSSQKNFSSRIIELLSCFENEALHINGRRYKLPLFRDIAPRKISRGAGKKIDALSASCEEGHWFIVLKPDMICENDVQEIMLEAKKFDQRPSRCVIVSLSRLDENARVKALQERMWIWDESELNTLLNVFDQPYILEHTEA